MKRKLFTIIIILSLTFTLKAQYAMLHSTTGVQVFEGTSALDSAYNASVTGDTIYLSGGGFTAPASIDKGLIVFGVGHYSEYVADRIKTIISNTINLSENADGFRIEGVEIAGSIILNSHTAVDNVLIRYSRILNIIDVQGDGSIAPSNNLSIFNCVIGKEIRLSNAVNAKVQNSIVAERILHSHGNTISNNILMYNYTGAATSYSIHGDNNTCNNNIFLQSGHKCIDGNSNQVNNNIFVSTDPYLGVNPESSGNHTGITHGTIFVNQSGYVFSYEHDYQLQAPETYPGVDGSQVGIYGGDFVYKEGAIPSNPHLNTVNISSTTTPDGKLHIEINATAQ